MPHPIRRSNWNAVALAALALSPIGGVYAQDEGAAEREILDVFARYTAALKRDALVEAMACFHPEFRRWNLMQPKPIDLVTLRDGFERYLQRFDVIAYEVIPIAVQISDTTAVALVRYRETVRDSTGLEAVNAGSWSATLVRDGEKWLFFSWTFVPG